MMNSPEPVGDNSPEDFREFDGILHDLMVSMGGGPGLLRLACSDVG
jgi:hypothetical protein